MTIDAAAKPGRNDPCPCGSGRKYKLCCGAATAARPAARPAAEAAEARRVRRNAERLLQAGRAAEALAALQQRRGSLRTTPRF